MRKIEFFFENDETAAHFMSWLCGMGEQDYWNWMDVREGEEDGKITAINFDYDFENYKVYTQSGRTTDDS